MPFAGRSARELKKRVGDDWMGEESRLICGKETRR
jgi:hypothetical protein